MNTPKRQNVGHMSHDELIALISTLSTMYLEVCAERDALNAQIQVLSDIERRLKLTNDILREQNSRHINTNRALSDKLYK